MSKPSATAHIRQKGTLSNKIITPVMFTLSILLSAGLLFLAQPLMARGLSPIVGGSIITWSVTIFFLQVMIIFGYLYAHLLTRLPRIRHQIGIHVLFWLATMSTMPAIPALQAGPGIVSSGSIEVDMLVYLAGTIGLPLIFLGANMPLIQTWYGRTRGPSAHDPYFMYGASNMGALIALMSYPVIAEPILGLERLALIWSGLFACTGPLLFFSAFWTTRDHPDAKTVRHIENRASDMRMIWAWGCISFISSALMLAVTTRLSMDFGSVSMVWVTPLALYLITLLAGFQSKPMLSDRAMIYVYPAAILAIALVGITMPFGGASAWSALALILSFTMISLHLHRRLYSLRPDTSRLTVYYLTIALGCAFGGAFNALLAPSLMKGLYELPLIILGAAGLSLLKNNAEAEQQTKWIGLALVILLLAALTIDLDQLQQMVNPTNLSLMITVGAMSMIRQNLRIFGVSLICLSAALSIRYDERIGYTTHASRNFFGTHRVTETGDFRTYISGTSIQGGQAIVAQGKPPEPLGRYERKTSLGQIAFSDDWKKSGSIGMIGLGTGSMLAYRHQTQKVKIYEIDPEVIKIATDVSKFSFVEHYGQGVMIVAGDARASLDREAANDFNILLVDIVSSGVSPANFMTYDALRTYDDHLAEDGFMIFHITNMYYDFARPLAAAAEQMGYKAFRLTTGESRFRAQGYPPLVDTVVLSRPDHHPEFLHENWALVQASPAELWTDDRLDFLGVLKLFNRPN